MTQEQWDELVAQVEAHGVSKICFYSEDEEIYLDEIVFFGGEIQINLSE